MLAMRPSALLPSNIPQIVLFLMELAGRLSAVVVFEQEVSHMGPPPISNSTLVADCALVAYTDACRQQDPYSQQGQLRSAIYLPPRYLD